MGAQKSGRPMVAPTFTAGSAIENVRAGIARPPLCAPILFFLFFEKEKNRRGVRRSQLHSVSAGAAKAPYPQPSSSFPNCDRFTGSQFGSRKFYNAARYLDNGGQAAAEQFCDATPPKGDAQSAETFRVVGSGATDS